MANKVPSASNLDTTHDYHAVKENCLLTIWAVRKSPTGCANMWIL